MMEIAFLSPSPMEIAVILVIALIVLGPSKLPEAAKSVGKGMREMRNSFQGLTDDDDDDRLPPEPEDVVDDDEDLDDEGLDDGEELEDDEYEATAPQPAPKA